MQNRQPVFITGALILVLSLGLFGLAACDITASSTTTVPATIVTKCGTVAQGVTLQSPTQAHTAENCFWQAYQQCHLATLTYVMTGVDTADTHTLTLLQQPGGCRITDVSANHLVSGNHTTTKTYTCTDMVQQSSGGLTLQSCGDEGNLQIGS